MTLLARLVRALANKKAHRALTSTTKSLPFNPQSAIPNPQSSTAMTTTTSPNPKSEIRNPQSTPSTLEIAEPVYLVPVEQITQHPDNRKHFDEDALQELADSIAARGLLTPILLRQVANGYELVAGERRWRAAILAGLTHIKAIVREHEDAQALENLLVENFDREDLHELDQARILKKLKDLHGFSVEQLADRVKRRKVGWVYARLKLLELTQPCQSAFYEGAITSAHAIALARLQPKDQTECLANTLRLNYSSRQLIDYIQRDVILRLEKAPFDTDSAILLPKAGPCTLCPKNTANELAGTLFEPGVKTDPAKGECTDRGCHQKKMAAFIAEQQKKVLDEHGVKPLKVSGSYNAQGGTLGCDDYRIVTQDTPGAVPAVSVENHGYGGYAQQAGQILWIKPYAAKTMSQEDQTAAEAKRKDKARAKLDFHRAWRRCLIEAIDDARPTENAFDAIRLLFRKELACNAYSVARTIRTILNLPDPEGETIGQMQTWAKTSIHEASAGELLKLFTFWACSHELRIHDYMDPQKPQRLIELACALDLNVDAIEAAAKQLSKPPKGGKAKPKKEEAPAAQVGTPGRSENQTNPPSSIQPDTRLPKGQRPRKRGLSTLSTTSTESTTSTPPHLRTPKTPQEAGEATEMATTAVLVDPTQPVNAEPPEESGEMVKSEPPFPLESTPVDERGKGTGDGGSGSGSTKSTPSTSDPSPNPKSAIRNPQFSDLLFETADAIRYLARITAKGDKFALDVYKLTLTQKDEGVEYLTYNGQTTAVLSIRRTTKHATPAKAEDAANAWWTALTSHKH